MNTEYKEIIIQLIIKLVLVVICNVIMVLAYYFNDKKNGVKGKAIKYEMIFFFGIWYVAVDFFKKLFSKKEKINKDFIKIACISVAAYMVFCFAVPKIVFPDTEKAPYFITYYDRYGNPYNSREKVVYYTKDGCEYTFNEDDFTYVCKYKPEGSEYKDTYDFSYVYLDRDGYLVLSDYIFECDENSSSDWIWYDKATDEYYMSADSARWNQKGILRSR